MIDDQSLALHDTLKEAGERRIAQVHLDRVTWARTKMIERLTR